MDLEQIEKIARAVRRQILRDKGGVSNQCYEASLKIYQKLGALGYQPRLIQGRVLIDAPSWDKIHAEYTDEDLVEMASNGYDGYRNVLTRPLHYWVEVDLDTEDGEIVPVIVDSTGNQFNDEIDTEELPEGKDDVIIAPYEELPRYIRDSEIQP